MGRSFNSQSAFLYVTEPSLNFEVMMTLKNYVCFEATSANFLWFAK